MPKLFPDAEISEHHSIEKKLFIDVNAAAHRMLNLLDDYEKHPNDYHDGSLREPKGDERAEYIDFYRGKAYGYRAIAYASLGDYTKAREYIALFDQTIVSQNVTGRWMLIRPLRLLGEYNRVTAIYDEVERLLNADTVNQNYLEILRGRAEILTAQGRHAEARRYWRRQAALNELLTERLMQGKAHLYAARFHAAEQQREIERQREATHRVRMSRRVIAFIGLLILLFALFAVRQLYKTQKHNQILAQQISDAVEYKEKYKKLKRAVEKPLERPSEADAPQTAQPTTDDTQQATQSDTELFNYLRDFIEREQLFLDPNFERQTLIKLTGISKNRIGAAFAQGSGHERLTSLVREMRLDYAVRLMNEHPELSVNQVRVASGFTSADTFTRNFRTKYGMTPTAYCASKS